MLSETLRRRIRRLRLAMEADQEFLDALAAVWRIPPPGPDNLLACALISLATAHPASSRADVLASLLDQGASLRSSAKALDCKHWAKLLEGNSDGGHL